MDEEKLNQIADFARMMGFSVTLDGENYARFYSRCEMFIVDITYDYTKRLFTENTIYIETSTEVMFDSDTAKAFNCELEKAIVIMNKLENFAHEE